ncbi:hypothetical protein GUJ93_ZPchr0005g15636 [Zizania palustris]|uniref:Uncharacterized protein n=1 Tax=Zizania palustris TaxID=103762 RepID=A0A8J5STK0_ZIZPA|nr:hypothetical protein GUJ93_ZPchr0005g15636 [Zizania palustris]
MKLLAYGSINFKLRQDLEAFPEEKASCVQGPTSAKISTTSDRNNTNFRSLRESGEDFPCMFKQARSPELLPLVPSKGALVVASLKGLKNEDEMAKVENRDPITVEDDSKKGSKAHSEEDSEASHRRVEDSSQWVI